MAFKDCRPFRLRFLDAILAEIALAGGDQRLDLRGRAALGDSDQGDVTGLAARKLAGSGNRIANFGKAESSVRN